MTQSLVAQSTEPPTTAKVVLETNYGALEIDLWAREAPRACRNFIQLCLEGYYDQTIFHRVIKDFMVQGGDPSGSGTGGESIYGEPFPDEFHQRLSFSHRGIVAMANDGERNQNGSQFFMTSATQCSWLDRKHTIFGKIEGETIYNLLKINELEVNEETDRPICDPIPRIERAIVVENPFDDIAPRQTSKPAAVKPSTAGSSAFKNRLASRAIKNKSLISFAEDDGEDDDVVLPKRKGIRA